MTCRNFTNSDSGRKWEWGGWYCTASPENCPTNTWGDTGAQESSTNKGATNNAYCFGDAFQNTGRERVKCRWNKEKYETSGYKEVDKVLPCCLGNKDGRTDAECHPDYCSGNATCNDWFKNTYCNSGDNIFGTNCSAWAGANRTDSDGILNSKCVGSKLNTTPCLSWCQRNSAQCAANFKAYCKTPGQFSPGSYCATQSLVPGFEIDTVAQSFCAEHLNDDFCACFKAIKESDSAAANADPDLKKLLSRPECYITRCSSGLGYQTANMRNNLQGAGCPAVQVCKNTLNALGNTSTGLENISQNCTQTSTTTTNTGIPSTSTPTAPSTPSGNPVQTLFDKLGYGNLPQNKQYFIIFVFLAFIYALLFNPFSKPRSINVSTSTVSKGF